jgi:CRISPR/Cas system-associated endoribonuclease Cas2
MKSTYLWVKETGYAPASISAFRDAILTPTYAGLRVHQGTVMDGVKGTWEPIITEEEHYRIVARVQRGRVLRQLQAIPGPEPRHLLSGIAICGKCGEGLRHKNLKDRKACYVCDKGHVARLADDLDRLVERRLFLRMSTVDPADFENDDDPEIQEAIKELEDMETTLEEWIQSAEKGEVTPAAFARIEKGLRQRIAEKRRSITPAPRKEGLPIKDLEQNWERFTMREKRDTIRALFSITVPPLGRRARAGEENVLIEPL